MGWMAKRGLVRGGGAHTVFACVAVCFGSLVSSANAAFSGQVCPMLKAAMVAAVHVPSNCAQQKTETSSLGTVRVAVWGVNAVGKPRLGVSIDKASSVFLTVAESHKAPGNSIGIGSWSGEQGLANGK